MKTKTRKEPAQRYLGLDLSLSPGVATIEVRKGADGRSQPYLIAAESVATSTEDNDAVRSLTVESFIARHIYANRPYVTVLREDFTAGRNKRATQTIFNAWAAADRALHTYGYTVNDVKPPLSPTSVKKLVAGSGKAEKPEVAAGVRKLLRLADDYKFAAGYDDSDALAVILAYLIREELIDV